MHLRWRRIDGTKKVIEPCEREREKLQERGAMPEEEGDVIRDYTAMHEDNFLCSWQREDLVEKEERKKKVNERIRECERSSGKERRKGKERRRKKRTRR